MADGLWTPPVKRLPDDSTFEELMDHHLKEVSALMEVIQELAGRLVGDQQDQ